MVKFLATFAVFVSLSSWSLQQLHVEIQRDVHASHERENEVLYLPDGTGLKLLSFGYSNLLADLLWFRTISYFGKHYQTDKNYHWLDHMCHLVTDLNPQAESVYEFCSTMMSWELRDGARAAKILTKAIKANPSYWRYHYLRGFIFMYFLHDAEGAQADFIAASKLPNTPPFVARLAATKMTLSNPVDAIGFLREMIKNTEDPNQRAVLQGKLNDIYDELQKTP